MSLILFLATGAILPFVTLGYVARPGCREYYPSVTFTSDSPYKQHRHRNQQVSSEDSCDLDYWIGEEPNSLKCMSGNAPFFNYDCKALCNHCYQYTAQYIYCFCMGTQTEIITKCIADLCSKPIGRPGCKQWYPEYFAFRHKHHHQRLADTNNRKSHKRQKNVAKVKRLANQNQCSLDALVGLQGQSCVDTMVKHFGTDCLGACQHCYGGVAQHYYCFCGGSDRDVMNKCSAVNCPAGSKMSKGTSGGFKKHKHHRH